MLPTSVQEAALQHSTLTTFEFSDGTRYLDLAFKGKEPLRKLFDAEGSYIQSPNDAHRYPATEHVLKMVLEHFEEAGWPEDL